ncbi:MAG: periplasmic heavy metal sensor [bacterium]|nr:periplasmic heavy metal sensor [bacterium]
MGQDKKNNKISLLTVILIILNIVLLFTIWYPRLTSSTPTGSKKTGTGKSTVKIEDPDIPIERYLREELHFSGQQVLTFKQMQAHHLPRANALRARTYRLRNEIMTLLFNDNPNKSRIEELSYQLGVTHEKLEKEIFFHFMDLMTQCRPEQRENLKKLLRKVFEKYRPPSYPGVDTETNTGENLPPDLQPPPRPKRRDDLPRREKEPGGKGRPENDRVKRDLETLTQRLNLTPTQVKQVEEILLRLERRGDSKQLKDNADKQIEALLTPQQLQKFRRFKEETRQPPQGTRRVHPLRILR